MEGLVLSKWQQPKWTKERPYLRPFGGGNLNDPMASLFLVSLHSKFLNSAPRLQSWLNVDVRPGIQWSANRNRATLGGTEGPSSGCCMRKDCTTCNWNPALRWWLVGVGGSAQGRYPLEHGNMCLAMALLSIISSFTCARPLLDAIMEQVERMELS